MALFRRPVRSRPIQFFLISMFAVPLVSLVALWIFAASITVSSAISNQNYNATTRSINAGIQALAIGLPQERAETYLWLVTDKKSPETSLLATRKVVDRETPAARAALQPQLAQLSASPRQALSTLLTDLGQIGQIRAAIDAGTMGPSAAFQAYTAIIDDQFLYFDASIQDKSAELADVSIGAVDGDYSLEMASREVALVDGVLIDRGVMSPPVRQLFVASATSRQLLLNAAVATLTPSLRIAYTSFDNSPLSQQFGAMESQLLASTDSGPIPVNPRSWQSVSTGYLAGLQAALTRDGNLLASQSASLTDRLMTEAILVGGVGLAAVAGSVFLLVWFGRKVKGDLGRLHGSVRGMAEERLPRVVQRLRQGDDVDVAAESPAPATSTIREVSQIAESFGTVQEAAVAAAVDQAGLRKGVNQVFLNISMRNQSLLHRQLALMDSMERRTSEPEALADLFRLDHLTTRMRRHAEGLIILSGATPGRGWRDPVPVVDVLRAAIAEVEDYVRVDVVSESRDLVIGSAVSDVIHLVAELIENATVFSPPNTRIEVKADRVGTGMVVEIEDRGLGLTAEERADINRRLASSPEFDLANSEQLGLFVVGRLAARHGIKVALRESMYGGTTAILLLPFGVIVREEDAGLHEPAPNGERGQPVVSELPALGLAGRHRLLPPAPGTAPSLPAASAPWGPEAMTPWPQAFQPSPPSEELPLLPPSSPGSNHLGMPIRVPQANLAPQLRASDRQAQQAAAREAPQAGARPPEATRDMLILMQQGWQRGRVDDLDDPEGAPGNGAE